MSKKMLVNATLPEENRVAIVVDGILAGLDIEVSGREPTKGNIYKAVVVRVETGLQAAFVDYGAERLGFLQIDEVNATTVKPDYNQGENGKSRPRINELLHRGQEIVVQITKEERGTKGAALTTYLSLAGRYMVCMPGSQTRGVSRKVESDSERKQLKKAMESLDLAEGIGYIVRTAGLGKTKEELQRDFSYLKHLYDEIRDKGNSVKAPALIYKESNLVIRSIRDTFTTDMDEVLIDDPDVFNEAKEFFNRIMPEYVGLVKLHQERRPIFSRYQIEDQIETINQNKVPLPSGGSIVIDPTEALVAIDVNSGKMTSEQGVEATAFKANLEAADEVGRQLRLRDLGGLIVIDFIDMRESKHNRKVEAQLKKSVELDKARISIGRISKFGLLEMSRQRMKAALAEGSSLACPHCHGSGRVKSAESLAVGLLRRIHAGVAKGQVGRVSAHLPLEVASYLLNDKREDLFDLERRYNLQIHIHGELDYLTDQVELDFQKREKEKLVQTNYVEAGSVPLPPEVETGTAEEQPDENGEAAEKPKRKRRRRRRKPAAGAEAAGASTTETTTAESEEPKEETQTVESTATAPQEALETVAVQGVETATTSETEEKPKRRRRRRKPATAATSTETSATETITPESEESTTDTQTVETSALAPQETAETVTAQDTESATPQTEQKPKRRRPSRRKSTPQPEEAASSGPVETIQTATENAPTEPGSVAAEPVSEQPEKPKRRRSPRRKTAEQPSPAEETAEIVTTEARHTTPSETNQTEEKPKPPRRRTARKKPAESPVEATADAVEKTSETEVSATPKSEEKPKRTRAPRKKPAAKTEITQEAPAQTAPAEAAPEGTDQASEKPKPRRRAPRKKTTEAPLETSTETTSPVASPAAAPVEKPIRKRAPRKKAAPKTETAQKVADETATTATAPAEEKPKPRRRTTRRKTTEKEPETPESNE